MRYKYLGIWRDITWAEYLENVRHTCLGLKSLGIDRGDRVAVIGENRPEWLFSDLAAMAAGAVTVGIYTTSSAHQCEYVVGHSGSKVFIAEDEEQLDKALLLRERTPDLTWIVVMDPKGLRSFSDPMVMTFQDLLERGKELDDKEPHRFAEMVAQTQPDDLALIIYTSGTTGPPKGAMLTHRNVTWTTWSIGEAAPLDPSDELLSFLPLSHIAERMFSVVPAHSVRVHGKFHGEPGHGDGQLPRGIADSNIRCSENLGEVLFGHTDSHCQRHMVQAYSLWHGRICDYAGTAGSGSNARLFLHGCG